MCTYLQQSCRHDRLQFEKRELRQTLRIDIDQTTKDLLTVKPLASQMNYKAVRGRREQIKLKFNQINFTVHKLTSTFIPGSGKSVAGGWSRGKYR